MFFLRRGASTRAEFEAIRSQIESVDDASRYRARNLQILEKRDEQLADEIFRCTDDDPCAKVLCARCARRYRLWLASELLHVANVGPQAFVATILLETVHAPALKRVDLDALHERARKRIVRADVSAAIGGTEASYDAQADTWTIHLHLLVFDSFESGRAKLRRAFNDSTLDRPVVCQPLRDRPAQLSYLQKFHTYHRPGSSGSRRGRPYPLKPEQIDQLAQWTRRLRFEDFLFVLGLRRRGSRFDHESGFKRALAEAQPNSRGRPRDGDGGDSGDGSRQRSQSALRPSAQPKSSVTPSKANSNQLYRVPVPKRAIREDKSRASARANSRVGWPTVATTSQR
jgi:hypothetical protein